MAFVDKSIVLLILNVSSKAGIVISVLQAEKVWRGKTLAQKKAFSLSSQKQRPSCKLSPSILPSQLRPPLDHVRKQMSSYFDVTHKTIE